ncbi:hypothetical protein cyc_07930 [Cyclospora cayetanensis]|uniref:AB hydrolase-1 domain-containing protein n=1 Tax=Cyclospora cayetanensis TaxID=88456 RepID=A0A1D3D2N9_9EIME|nr:hypothetical protein cyc_07930 [Cyclospora cayetanensis]
MTLAYELIASSPPAPHAVSPLAPLTLVVVHGMLVDKASLRPFCQLLSKALAGSSIPASVYLVDLPAHGDSPSCTPLSVVSMGEQLLSFLASLNLSRCFLLGHSLGGQVCMAAALADMGNIIGGLCVIDISPVNYFLDSLPLPNVAGERNIVELFALLATLDVDALKTKQQAVEALQQKDAQITQSEADYCLNLLQEQHSGKGGPLAWRMDLRGLADALQSKVLCWNIPRGSSGKGGVFVGPMLLVRGERSPWVSVERHEKRILELFPKGRIHTLAGVGHVPQIDDPEGLLKVVLQAVSQWAKLS